MGVQMPSVLPGELYLAASPGMVYMVPWLSGQLGRTPPQSGSQSPFAPLTWRVVVPSTAFWATKRPPDLQLSGPLNHPMVASRVRPEHPELCPSAILVVSAQLWPKNLFSYGSHLGKVLELPGRTKALESEAQLLTGALGIRMSPPWDSLARQWPFHPDESILSLLTSVL